MKKEERSREIPGAKEQPQPVRQSWPVRVTHFLVNFVGIGWVLNAIVSIALVKGVDKYAPKLRSSAESGFKKGLERLAKIMRHTPGPHNSAELVSKDTAGIGLLSIGGFLILPLQKLYAAHRVRITNWVEKLFGKKSPDVDTANAKNPQEPESVESTSHWVASRLVAFFAGASAYIILKYFARDKYNKLNESFSHMLAKVLPERMQPDSKTAEYFLAEQIAAVTAVTGLAITKTTLDKMFPPKANGEEPYKKFLAEGGKSFQERSETAGAGITIH